MSSTPVRPLPQPRFFRALPAYLGGKRRLCPLIFSLISEQLPRGEWPANTLLDPFSGGGAVALYAKAQGFHTVASDQAERAAVVARALVANCSVMLRREDALSLFCEPEFDYPHVAERHSPAVFTAERARWLDRALAQARVHPDSLRSLLELVVIKLALRAQPMSLLTASDAGAAASGDFDRISPRRLGHYLKAARPLSAEQVWAAARAVNDGVFGGSGEALSGDARDVLSRSDAAVVYLDPPSPGTSRYEREYAALDALLGDAPPKPATAHARRAAGRRGARPAARALLRWPHRHPRRTARDRGASPHGAPRARRPLPTPRIDRL